MQQVGELTVNLTLTAFLYSSVLPPGRTTPPHWAELDMANRGVHNSRPQSTASL